MTLFIASLACLSIMVLGLKWLLDNGLWLHFVIGSGLLLAWLARER